MSGQSCDNILRAPATEPGIVMGIIYRCMCMCISKDIHLSTLIITIKFNHKNLLCLPIMYHNGVVQSGTIRCSLQGLSIVAGQVSGTLVGLGQRALTTPACAGNKGRLHLESGIHHRVLVSLKGECRAPIYSPGECFPFQSSACDSPVFSIIWTTLLFQTKKGQKK